MSRTSPWPFAAKITSAVASAVLAIAVFTPASHATTGSEHSECTIIGTAQSDVLYGTEGPDVICGLGGHDIIFGYGGDDTLLGGDGADRLLGGDGNDILDGGADTDVLSGELGNDVLDAGDGDDTAHGGPGDDTVSGGRGSDILFGGEGDDALSGGDGDDRLFGDAGADVLDGGAHWDRCADDSGDYLGCESLSTPPSTHEDQDADGDGIPDVIELAAGTKPLVADSDNDGLTDEQEFTVATDPTKWDTDGLGVGDAHADRDGDGLSNSDEFAGATDPAAYDTDGDGLGDGEEVTSGTSPVEADTDGDGLTDDQEPLLGVDPRLYDTDGDGVSDGEAQYSRELEIVETGATVTVTGQGASVLAASLEVHQEAGLEDVPGLISTAVAVEGAQGLTGTLTIPFDGAALTSESQPVLVHQDAETGLLDLPENQVTDLENLTVTATTNDFSPFFVVDLTVFEAVWATEMVEPRDGSTGKNVDVVLAIDSSGSMTSNDPSRQRITASDGLVDNLIAGDQAAVVDFDSTARVLQSLTTDRDSVKQALQRIDASGGTSLSAAMLRSLQELNTNGNPDHQRVIVLLTDGQGSYTSGYTNQAANSDTIVYTVGLGRGADAATLTAIAEGTGGAYFYAASSNDLTDAFDQIQQKTGAQDSDGDGLSDQTEVAGARDHLGRIYVTDPHNPDTDGDGLSDGGEMGMLTRGGPFGSGMSYQGLSNSLVPDTDYDGLLDSVEVPNEINARSKDHDRDGLDDAAEWNVHGTDPADLDTDGDWPWAIDPLTDAWEVANADKGFDPLVYDEQVEWWVYANDFLRGALCGDGLSWTTFGGFCDGTSVAFLGGSIAAGFFVIGDVRDAIAGLLSGDFVNAGAAVAGIVPVVGDAVKTGQKIDRHLDRVKQTPELSEAAIRAIGRMDHVPANARITALRLHFGDDVVDAVKARGVGDDFILRHARRGMSPKHLRTMLDEAAVVHRNVGSFAKEIDAENYIRASLKDPIGYKFAHYVEDGSQIRRRYYDIIDLDTGIAHEVKIGKVSNAGRAVDQSRRDSTLNAAAQRGEIDEFEQVIWDFTPRNGEVGPDEKLLKYLMENDIEYVIYLP